MKILAAAVCFFLSLCGLVELACQTDAVPDRLTVTGGHTEYGIDHSQRNLEGNSIEVGLGWDLTKPEPPPSDNRYEEWLWSKPEPVKEPEPVKQPDPTAPPEEHKKSDPTDWWPLLPGFALAVFGALLKEKH